MVKNVAHKVRAAYEQRPYPAVSRDALRRLLWQLPPWEWMNTVAQPAQTPPQRILVAGCGTGLEAFAFRRRFPRAEIIGIDFSARSIRIARRVQTHSWRSREVRFIPADLTRDGFGKLVGRDFDFISCHGVLSYIPAPARALRNLARCLAPEGVLYLGVNGTGHFSESWRRFLSAFGFDMTRWPGGERLWRHLKLSAVLAGDARGRIPRAGAGVLAADLFGPLMRNLPLAQWVRMCRGAGLHFRGSHGAQRLLWPAINDGSYERFIPRSRAEVAQLLEVLRPSAFHRLIFTRQPELVPPWQKPAELLKWRPFRASHLRRFREPTGRGVRVLKIESRTANTSIELRGACWEIELLRGSNGERTLREILAPVVPGVAPATLRSQLYLFYQLNLLNLCPPAAD